MSVQETRMQTIIIFDIAFDCASGTEITHFSFNVTKGLGQAYSLSYSKHDLGENLETFHCSVHVCNFHVEQRSRSSLTLWETLNPQ